MLRPIGCGLGSVGNVSIVWGMGAYWYWARDFIYFFGVRHVQLSKSVSRVSVFPFDMKV